MSFNVRVDMYHGHSSKGNQLAFVQNVTYFRVIVQKFTVFFSSFRSLRRY